ncbi:unnamed protein product, partial [Prorocentrum cordatum]
EIFDFPGPQLFFDMVASGRKRALGAPAAGPVHKRLRTGLLAITAGHQARRGLVPPLIPEEMEPGAVVKHALGLQRPFGLDAPLADDLFGAVDILRRGSEAASRSRSEARSKWQARAEALKSESLEQIAEMPDPWIRRLFLNSRVKPKGEYELGEFVHLALFREMHLAAGGVDAQCHDEFWQGLPIVGRVRPSRRQVNHVMQEFGPFVLDRFESAFLDLPGAVTHDSGSKPVRKILDWFGATRDLKQMRMKDAACEKWNKIISGAREVENAPIEETVDYNALRHARIRVDCVAMLLWRERFARLDGDGFDIHLHSDGSPQWAGVELSASTFDILTPCAQSPSKYHVGRRLLPLINIGMSMFSALGKCFALLWQVFLIAGPRFEDVRTFLNRVRSLTVDFGTERLLADYEDVLPWFLRSLSGVVPSRFLQVSHLLPRCLLAPGWRHTVDRIIRRTCGGLPFFPLFLRRVKAISNFVRHYRLDSTRLLKDVEAFGAADLVQTASLPYFAEWRWGTSHGVLKSLESCIVAVMVSIDLGAFIKRQSATKMVKDVQEAFGSVQFHIELKFMVWFTSWLTELQNAATWCPCHLGACKRKEYPDCNVRGRILPIVPDIRSHSLAESIATMEQWTVTQWRDANTLRLLQGSVRWAHGLILEVTRFAYVIPYLFNRLDQPHVKEECVRQYTSKSHDQHHGVSQYFMDPAGPMRRLVDGEINDEHLKREVESVANISLDDNVESRKLGRNPRCAKKLFTDKLYMVLSGFCDGFGEGDAEQDDDGDGDCPTFDDIDGGGGALVARRPPKRPKPDVAATGDGGDRRRLREQVDMAMLVREWLISSTKQFEYLSLWATNADGNMQIRVLQILSCNVNVASVATFESTKPNEFGLKVCVQELEVWKVDTMRYDTNLIDVFTAPPPEHVDMLGLVGAGERNRRQMKYWTWAESDLDGCLALTSPRPRCPTVELKDAPVLNGCVQFKSNGPQAYFKALPKDPTTVPGLPAIKYTENDGGSHDGPAPAQLLGLPTRSATSEAVARVDADIDGDDGSLHRVPAPLQLADDGGSSAHSRTSPSRASVDEGSVDGDNAVGPDSCPPFIDGMAATRESHLGRGGFGLRVKFSGPSHVNCSCYRSVKLWTEKFGVDAPALFLNTWMAKSLDNTKKWNGYVFHASPCWNNIRARHRVCNATQNGLRRELELMSGDPEKWRCEAMQFDRARFDSNRLHAREALTKQLADYELELQRKSELTLNDAAKCTKAQYKKAKLRGMDSDEASAEWDSEYAEHPTVNRKGEKCIAIEGPEVTRKLEGAERQGVKRGLIESAPGTSSWSSGAASSGGDGASPASGRTGGKSGANLTEVNIQRPADAFNEIGEDGVVSVVSTRTRVSRGARLASQLQPSQGFLQQMTSAPRFGSLAKGELENIGPAKVDEVPSLEEALTNIQKQRSACFEQVQTLADQLNFKFQEVCSEQRSEYQKNRWGKTKIQHMSSKGGFGLNLSKWASEQIHSTASLSGASTDGVICLCEKAQLNPEGGSFDVAKLALFTGESPNEDCQSHSAWWGMKLLLDDAAKVFIDSKITSMKAEMANHPLRPGAMGRVSDCFANVDAVATLGAQNTKEKGSECWLVCARAGVYRIGPQSVPMPGTPSITVAMDKPLLVHAVRMKDFLSQGIAVNNYEQFLATATGADIIKQSTLVIVNPGDSLYVPTAWWWSLTVLAGLRDTVASDESRAKGPPKAKAKASATAPAPGQDTVGMATVVPVYSPSLWGTAQSNEQGAIVALNKAHFDTKKGRAMWDERGGAQPSLTAVVIEFGFAAAASEPFAGRTARVHSWSSDAPVARNERPDAVAVSQRMGACVDSAAALRVPLERDLASAGMRQKAHRMFDALILALHEDVARHVGTPDWIATERFGVVQKCRTRGVDNATLVNEAACATEKLQVLSTDHNLSALKVLRATAGRRLAGWVLDESNAYRQIPVLPEHRRYAVVVLWGPFKRRPAYFVMIGPSFGNLASVHNYNRWASIVTDILVKLFHLFAFNYYDDKFGFTTGALVSEEIALTAEVRTWLGIDFSARKLQAGQEIDVLGVSYDFAREQLRVAGARKAELTSATADVLRAGVLEPGPAGKLRGKLGFVSGRYRGRFGRSILRALSERQCAKLRQVNRPW